MNASNIIKQMCSKELTAADISAICKARSFASKEMKNREVLENILLSDRGLIKAFDLLSRQEIIVLHLMKKDPKPVDITFFDRIYGDEGTKRGWNDTFNQTYKDLFKKTRSSLVRRGILFFSEDTLNWQKDTKLEGMLFYFPTEFHEYLPSLFENAKKSREKGTATTLC